MYLDILNDDMVGFAKTSARETCDHLFLSYGIIMRKAWDPQQPVETLFKQIQDCVDYAEAGGVTIGPAQQSVTCTKIFPTWSFMSACHRWNEKEAARKTCANS
jgi:hypothetical protein